MNEEHKQIHRIARKIERLTNNAVRKWLSKELRAVTIHVLIDGEEVTEAGRELLGLIQVPTNEMSFHNPHALELHVQQHLDEQEED